MKTARLCIIFLFFFALTEETHAEFKAFECKECQDTKSGAEQAWFWSIDKSQPELDATLNKANWRMKLFSPKVEAGDNKPLSVEIQHMKSDEVRGGVQIQNPNPNTFSYTFPAIGPTGLTYFRHKITRGEHPFQADPGNPVASHHDVYFAGVTIFGNSGADAEVRLAGYHGSSQYMYWVYTPTFKGTGKVDISYADRLDEPFTNPITVIEPDGSESLTQPDNSGEFPVSANNKYRAILFSDGGQETDVKLRFNGSGTSEMTLSFLENPAGLFSAANFVDGQFATRGYQPITLPMLFDKQDDIFVGVDLTQWALSGVDVTSLTSFDFNDGRSDLLPGFTVGIKTPERRPILLSPDKGFYAPEPFSGRLGKAGMVELQVVPIAEPAFDIPELDPLAVTGAITFLGFSLALAGHRRRKP